MHSFILTQRRYANAREYWKAASNMARSRCRKDLLGEKVKANGHHVLHQKGHHTVSVEVKNGKIAGVHVKHAKKGDVPVKKYKTNKKMAQTGGFQYASYQLAQAQSLGTIWIGYAYYDDYGNEVIYWFPYEMILDGDTGAIEYIPLV